MNQLAKRLRVYANAYGDPISSDLKLAAFELDKQRTVTFRYRDDETLEIELDGEQIGYFTHDNVGWDGMEHANKLARAFAAAFGCKIEVIEGDEDES